MPLRATHADHDVLRLLCDEPPAEAAGKAYERLEAIAAATVVRTLATAAGRAPSGYAGDIFTAGVLPVRRVTVAALARTAHQPFPDPPQ